MPKESWLKKVLRDAKECHAARPKWAGGWVCPVCGAGVAPSEKVCPCHPIPVAVPIEWRPNPPRFDGEPWRVGDFPPFTPIITCRN